MIMLRDLSFVLFKILLEVLETLASLFISVFSVLCNVGGCQCIFNGQWMEIDRVFKIRF